MNDLYTNRPDTTLDHEIKSALAAIMDTAPNPAAEPTDPSLLNQHDAIEKGPRILLGAAAATVLLVGVAGLLVLQQPNEPGPADSVPQASAPSVPMEPSPTTIPTTDPVAAPTGFYLPSYVPDGYEITNLAAYSDSSTSEPSAIRWLGTDDNDVVIAEFTARVMSSSDQPDLDLSPNTTVHGEPAMSFDSGEGIVVTWVEGNALISARGRDMTSEATIAAAEALVIDDEALTADLPESALPNFERIFKDTPDVASIVSTNLGLTRTDGQPGGFIGAMSSPNTNGDTLDSMQLRVDGYERQTIGGIERLVKIEEPDSIGPFTAIEWIDGDIVFAVSGRADPDEVIAVAESYTSTSSDEFAAAGTAITTSALSLDVADRATFGDGTAVSVRSLTPGPVGSGGVALCIEATTTQCRYSFSETSLGGAYQDSMILAFDVDGNTIMIVWQNSTEADRTGEPALRASGLVVDPSQAREPITTAIIGEQITTDAGRFIRVDVPVGESPPEVNFNVGDAQFGMTTATPQPNDY